jgi:hypothetical protein
MSIKSTYSSNKVLKDAVHEITSRIDVEKTRLLIYFCSSNYDSNEAAVLVKESFPGADVFGCTSAGEIVSGKMLNDSIVAMAFEKEDIKDIKIEVLENVHTNPDPAKVFQNFEQHFGIKVADMDYQKFLGIILIDGLSNSEEKLMENIGSKTNVNFIGGSAGDDLKFQKTFVFVNGRMYENAAILALIEPSVQFNILKTQSFRTLSKKFVASKVNEETREIIELDGKPAAEVYANAVGKSVAEAASCFMIHPFGIMVGDEPFVRSPQQLNGNSIKFYCNISEGSELTLLESKDIIADTKHALAEKLIEFGKPSGIINFNCILRTLELQDKNLTQEYSSLFSNIPTIGFSTYGEEYIGHINQTAVMAIFK